MNHVTLLMRYVICSQRSVAILVSGYSAAAPNCRTECVNVQTISRELCNTKPAQVNILYEAEESSLTCALRDSSWHILIATRSWRDATQLLALRAYGYRCTATSSARQRALLRRGRHRRRAYAHACSAAPLYDSPMCASAPVG